MPRLLSRGWGREWRKHPWGVEPLVEAPPPSRSGLRPEDTRPLGHLERPDDAADGRRARRVMATDGTRAWRLAGRDGGGLRHVCAMRRRRIFENLSPRQSRAAPATAPARRSWSYDHHSHGRRYCGRRSSRHEESGVAATVRGAIHSVFRVPAAGCKIVLQASICCAALAQPSMAVMRRHGRARRPVRSASLVDTVCASGMVRRLFRGHGGRSRARI